MFGMFPPCVIDSYFPGVAFQFPNCASVLILFKQEFVASGRHFKAPAVYQELHSVLWERFLGNGLVVEHIDHIWAAKRNLFNPAFHRR